MASRSDSFILVLPIVLVALEALTRADQARELIEREGLVVTTAKTGMAHAHPALKVERDAIATFGRLWGQLSLHRSSPYTVPRDALARLVSDAAPRPGSGAAGGRRGLA